MLVADAEALLPFPVPDVVEADPEVVEADPAFVVALLLTAPVEGATELSPDLVAAVALPKKRSVDIPQP